MSPLKYSAGRLLAFPSCSWFIKIPHKSIVEKCCERVGINFNEALAGIVGGNSLDAYRRFLSRPVHYTRYYIDLGINWEENKEWITELFINEMSSDSIKLVEGMSSLINELKENSIKVGVVTSTYKEVVLKNLPIFDCVVGNLDAPHKPAPDGINLCLKKLGIPHQKAVYVGDMLQDAYAAKNAGIDFIGVSWGYTTRKFLETLPVEVVDSVETLKNYLLF